MKMADTFGDDLFDVFETSSNSKPLNCPGTTSKDELLKPLKNDAQR